MATDNVNTPQDALLERGWKLITPEKTPKPFEEADEAFGSLSNKFGDAFTSFCGSVAAVLDGVEVVSDGVKKLTSDDPEESKSPTKTSSPEESLYSTGLNKATERATADPLVSWTPKESDIPQKEQDILSAGSADAPSYNTLGLADRKVLERTPTSEHFSLIGPAASGNLSVDSVSGLKGRLIDDGPAASVSLGVDSSAELESRLIDDDLASVPLGVESLAS